MNTLLDNLFARRPKIHYVCPPLCGCPLIITSSGAPAVSFDIASPLECVHYRIETGELVWDDYPGAICYNVYAAPPPDAPPPSGLPCVNYFLTNNSVLSSDFSWDPYPDALSYNVYRDLGNSAGYTRTQSEIPLSVLPIDCERVVVTANTPVGESQACVPLEYCSPCKEIDDWLGRIAAAGSPEPIPDEKLAICNFIAAMKAAALWDRMHSVNHFSPTSVVAALTWLKKGLMPEASGLTWNDGSHPGVCTTGVAGFKNNGGWADTHVPCTSMYSLLDCGLTVYTSQPGTFFTSDVVGGIMGAFDDGPVPRDCLSLYPWKKFDSDPVFGTTVAACWSFDSQIFGTPVPPQPINKGCGYVSLNRIGINDVAIYYAYSGGHFQVGGTNISQSVNVPEATLKIFQDGTQTNIFQGTVSFLALHAALTKLESAVFASIVQTLRLELGGGGV